MPTLSVPMKPLADQAFVSQDKRLPVNWTQPTGAASKHYQMAFRGQDHQGTAEAGCYFRPATSNRMHVEQCKTVGERFKVFTHAMLDGFQGARDTWRQAAFFAPMPIAGPVVTGPPGSLTGTLEATLIQQLSLPTAQGHEASWRDAVAQGLSQSFTTWQTGVSVPGLPWYPTYMACPTPIAPPLPSVPMPLSMCTSTGHSAMTAQGLKRSMIAAYGGEGWDGQFAALAHAIGTAVATAFDSWLSTQMVTGVMGAGTAAVMPGPVLGLTLPTPGVLAV
ncbi:MAG: hypothetical protein VYE15_00225 [Myxococcota bacterium]|nr:hypothetical protein [Myxococcota bacterium]